MQVTTSSTARCHELEYWCNVLSLFSIFSRVPYKIFIQICYMISEDLIAVHVKNSVFGMWCHALWWMFTHSGTYQGSSTLGTITSWKRIFFCILYYWNIFLAIFLCDFIACDEGYVCKVRLVKWGGRNLVRSDVLSSVLLTFPLFWDAALCRWASGVPHSEGIIMLSKQ